MEAFEQIVGIDLGTTNSVVAVLENDQPRVIHNSEGSTRTPSVVSFLENGEILVGEVARRQAAVNPRRTISSVKRLMGLSLADVESRGIALPFALRQANSSLEVEIGGKFQSPAQISAQVLAKMKSSAEEYLGHPVTKAVITVPAYFDDLQRQATREAGTLAGLEVLRLVNEPTAAAMAYGLGREENERVAVYDFGGGTFDITILDISNNTFEVLTSTGDTHLGGDDIDRLIVEELMKHVASLIQGEFRPDAMTVRRLEEAAEKAKCELSIARQTTIHLPFLAYNEATPIHLEKTITRAELEKLIEPLVERTIEYCQGALECCELRPSDIQKVILVGGTTRIPLVESRVEAFFQMQAFKGINPDEIVAMGAATQAGVLSGKLKEVLLLDVTPHSLGVEVVNDRVTRVVEKNSTIPAKSARLFTTAEDDQELVVVHVVQGESTRASENRSLGKFALEGIRRGKAGAARIQVVFHINVDGMVEVTAEDMHTGQQKAISLVISNEEFEPSQTRSRKKTLPARLPVAEAPVRITSHDNTVTQARRPTSVAGPEPVVAPAPAAPVKPAQPQSAPARQETPQSLDATEITVAYVVQLRAMNIEQMPLSATAKQALELLRDNTASLEAYEIYLKARDELRQCVLDYPEQVEIFYAFTCILIILGEHKEAKALLLASLDSPELTPKRLMELFDLLIEKFPEDEGAIAGRAEVAMRMGALSTAISDFERICSDEHGSETYVNRLAQLYQVRLAQGDDASVRFKLVKLLVRANRLDEAIESLQRLCQNEHYQQRALKVLGLCYWQKGMHYLAWQKFQQLPLTEEIKDILYRLAADMEDTEQLLNAKCVVQHLVDADRRYRDATQRLRKIEQQIKVQNSAFSGNSVPSAFLIFKDSRFVILEEIDRGSMGIIYRAKDKTLEEIVALKVLNDYLATDPVAIERFKREARAAKRLSHPNIVRIHDMYEFANKKFLSMEFIQGRDLKKILREKAVLDLEEFYSISHGVCDALAYAHEMGIVHRDVKPANIMITSTGHVKVTDFGIAKFTLSISEATHSGSQILGTPLYMSPEQIRGDAVDSRSDIYSLGATLYESLAGKPPFFEGNIEYHHLHTPAPPLPEAVPRAIAQAILRCLAKDPSERLASVKELAQALAEAKTGVPA